MRGPLAQRGLGFLRRLKLKSSVDHQLLAEDLGLLAVQIKGQEERIKKANAMDTATVLIQSRHGHGAHPDRGGRRRR